jgi:hypothetical protein
MDLAGWTAEKRTTAKEIEMRVSTWKYWRDKKSRREEFDVISPQCKSSVHRLSGAALKKFTFQIDQLLTFMTMCKQTITNSGTGFPCQALLQMRAKTEKPKLTLKRSCKKQKK